MVGSLHPRPVATFHFLSPHSAIVAFCEEILKHGTAWEALRGDLAAQKAEMTLEEERAATECIISNRCDMLSNSQNPQCCYFCCCHCMFRISLSPYEYALSHTMKFASDIYLLALLFHFGGCLDTCDDLLSNEYPQVGVGKKTITNQTRLF